MKLEEMYDYIIEEKIATKEELQLVLSINGNREETLTDVIQVRTGYDFDQHKEFEA